MLEALTVLVNADQEWSATHTRMTALLQAGGYRPQGDLPAGHGLNSEIAQLRFVAEGLKELVPPMPTFEHTNYRQRENEAAAARAADQAGGPGSEQDVSRRAYAW